MIDVLLALALFAAVVLVAALLDGLGLAPWRDGPTADMRRTLRLRSIRRHQMQEAARRERAPSGCPAHPYEGRAILCPELVNDCTPDCWTRK